MSKFLLLALLLLTGCSHKPLLKEGGCYGVGVRSTLRKNDPASASSVNELGSIKIVKIIDWYGEKTYIIQMLSDKWTKGKYDLVPKYSKPNIFGWAPAKAFDKHIGSIAQRFGAIGGDNRNQTVKCKDWRDE
jgi:hypothetical protein